MTTVITPPRMITSREAVEELFESARDSSTYSVVLTGVLSATQDACDEIVVQSLIGRGARTLIVQGGYAAIREHVADSAERHGVAERLWLR